MSATRRTQPTLEPLQLCIEILSFYGPQTRAAIEQRLPVVAAGLWTDERLVHGVRVEGDDTLHFCERENLDILLRLQRARSRQPLDPQPMSHWPAFMARQHGLGLLATPDREQLRLDVTDGLARLSGCSASIEVWLNDILQARFGDAGASLLGEILPAEGFVWRGSGRERVLMAATDEAPLFTGLSEESEANAVALTAGFRDPEARYTFSRIRDQHGASLSEFNRLWWLAVWSGLIAADERSVLRDAHRRSFELGEVPTSNVASRGVRRRPQFAPVGWSGNWYVVPTQDAPTPLKALEQSRQRIRILLDRYGVLCRELIVREGLSWSPCFRALRIMERAGEVSGGLFFEGLSGPQFASPVALHRLRQSVVDRHWWINATDPASPCGLGLNWSGLPRRLGANWLAFDASTLVMVVEQSGKSLRFDVQVEDPRLNPALELIRHLLHTRGRLSLGRINDRPAFESPYLNVLESHFSVYRDHCSVELSIR